MRGLFCLLIFLPSLAWSSDSDLHRLQGLLTPMQAMQADFYQVVRDGDGEVLQRSEGRMLWSRPNHFYWQVKAPREQLMIANGDVVWVYTPALSQAQKRPMPKISSTPMSLLSGHLTNLGQHFHVSSQVSSHGDETFHLQPLTPDPHFRSIDLRFHQRALQSISMVDTMDQITVITLTHPKLNQPFQAKQFEFKPPRGVEIVSF